MTSIDHRQHLRYAADFPCTVVTNNGERAKARIRNLSTSGLQIAGEHALIQTLYPNFKRLEQYQPITVSILFKVPTSYRLASSVEVSCSLVYCRRYKGESYWIGCQFHSMNAVSQRALEDYIKYFGVAQRNPGPPPELPSPPLRD